MRGADGVRDKMADLIRFEVGRKIPLLRDVWSLDQSRVPDVDMVVSGEAPDDALTSEGSTWVMVINPRLLKTSRVDIDAAGRPVYMTRYSCRVYVWAKGEDWAETIAARDNVALAVRLCFLEYPNMSATTAGDTGYRMHENTYTEEFGEPHRKSRAGGRLWAGAVLSIDVDCEESLADGSTRTPIGDVEQPVDTTANAVGPLAPLPETS